MDPLADMLTIIKNGNHRYKDFVDVPSSKMKQNIVKLLKEEGFIKGYRYVEDNKQGIIRIYLKYGPNKERAIHDIKRISKPSRRIYMPIKKIPKFKDKVGTVILSTSKGIMTLEKAKELNIGGEILFQIW
ncbi:MAG: 30S ribosomal protein S8 [Candidatus Goldbacteria bacterium]|nr:30S ribosomal protein S8 [Candidatus Goldiibacteriota bacterium]